LSTHNARAIIKRVRAAQPIDPINRHREVLLMSAMKPNLDSGQQFAQHADLHGSKFEDVNLSSSDFHDVDLSGSKFDDINFNGAVIKNTCLGDVSISDADYTGMRIDGILVTELLRAYSAAHPAADGP
jgi:uncharacterized protein YjbI with pentapeptide repeats